MEEALDKDLDLIEDIKKWFWPTAKKCTLEQNILIL